MNLLEVICKPAHIFLENLSMSTQTCRCGNTGQVLGRLCATALHFKIFVPQCGRATKRNLNPQGAPACANFSISPPKKERAGCSPGLGQQVGGPLQDEAGVHAAVPALRAGLVEALGPQDQRQGQALPRPLTCTHRPNDRPPSVCTWHSLPRQRVARTSCAGTGF